ncbi:MAG: TrkH family potassium uptake protein [Bacteroidetes bacterium]|jgi:trk system potassium uptake protein|nr:TrkH family potassium uptake protein [Bacteroidota bacterium]MBT5531102.1 TrkH family potassium uptake protein [Cytophagia bacterium]MBT3801171.1 TrkH family potassium uptake protein [Bacteroidota bacterium]MBT4728955.1 TrkH family potassium uptake protein [Bacteroidota bacterium]MBT4970608.1 TrkH family potassium uptake protein [Bacteroidota bacterium]
MLNFKLILNILGRLIVLTGLLMLTSAIVSFYYHSPDLNAILISSAICLVSGFLLHILTRKSDHVPGKKEGYFIVASGWLVISFFGMLPYILSGEIPRITDAFFETMSGFTTTGASILTNIEGMSPGLLYWRSMTQWIGGMGIIVMTIAIIPYLGIGGMQLFVAEVPGFAPDKLHPRIKETAKRLWAIYVLFTVAEIILLYAGEMPLFDAICHSFSTMATGGYSTKNASIAFYDSSYIHYIIILFMFIAGTNFTLAYFTLKGEFKKVIANEEFKVYSIGLIIAAVVIALVLVLVMGFKPSLAFRDGLFQVVSIVTTTGFITADYDQWNLFIKIFILALLFVGGCAGSTGGAMKVGRHLLLFKNTITEFRRIIHPRAIIPVRYNGKVVSPDIMSNILAFFYIYIMIFIFSTLLMIALGLDFNSAIGSVAATLGNIGPGIGQVGPTGNYAQIPEFGKWFLSFLMLVGRLELFTVIILFTKAFWKK